MSIKHYMKKILIFFCLIFTLPTLALDEDPIDKILFEEGTVLIHCSVPDGEKQMSTEVYEAALPKWAKSLKKHANEGRIIRAHFLSKLKKGIAIVVTGKNSEEALANAGLIFVEQDKILREAIHETNSEFQFSKGKCEFLEIGPVAVLPDNDIKK